jgi:hypothetical protein
MLIISAAPISRCIIRGRSGVASSITVEECVSSAADKQERDFDLVWDVSDLEEDLAIYFRHIPYVF